ncbi:hypothetical protein [Longimicrobium sp.]|uniref:hypothetical protein n=1 Tax=Longimicrobium sp. TaxID=2029185 RepID=UPI003B3AFA92
MDVTVITYAIYLAISIALTVWVARTLFANGHRFLVDVFGGDEDLAVSVNHLLVVGFYLINFAFVCLALRMDVTVLTTRGSVEALARKIGTVLLILGMMHFFNLYVFARMRRWRAAHVPAHG